MRLVIRLCPQADAEHRRSKRQYAHAFHYPKPVICVASAAFSLPTAHLMGLLAHEVGHLAAGPSASELAADRAAERCLGITMRYRDSRYGKSLQFLAPEDALKVRRAFRRVR